MYEEICYGESSLKEVIVKADLSSPVDVLATSMPRKVGNAALACFPVSEPRKAVTQGLQLSADTLQHTRQEFTEWNYHGREREKRLVISPTTMFVTYSQYSSYEVLKEDFHSVLSVLFAEFPDLRASRLGLRYINHIEPRNADPFRWGDYIDESLLGLFARFTEREHISRLFNIAEFKYEDLQVKFQFGVPNPDFPATIRRPLFVLDIDAYVQGLQDLPELATNIDRAHDQIQALFEESITDRLREVMRAR